MSTQPTPAIVDITVETFQQEVLERSTQVPVLIDFWAPWCGPCRTLGPMLENLAREKQGAFVLAKIDIDQNPELADAFRIQSVPSVIIVVGGRPVDGFMGALPEPQIRQFLEPYLQPAPDPVADARALEESGDRAGAIAGLRELLASADAAAEDPEVGSEVLNAMAPAIATARAELARMLLDAEDPDAARAELAKLTAEELEGDVAKSVRARLELAADDVDVSALEAAAQAAPDDLSKQIELGKALVGARRAEEGLELIFDVAKRNLSYDGGAPRKALLEMFELLGPDDPQTVAFQQRLSILLCP